MSIQDFCPLEARWRFLRIFLKTLRREDPGLGARKGHQGQLLLNPLHTNSTQAHLKQTQSQSHCEVPVEG